MKNKERRTSTRMDVNWEIHVDLSGKSSQSSSINVSNGGILIQSPVEMNSGSYIDLSIELDIDGSKQTCHATGEVVESRLSDDGYDIAVKFVRVDKALKNYLITLE